MNPFDLLDDILGPLNLFDRGGGLLMQLLHHDRAVRFTILRPGKGGTHTRRDVRQILGDHGVSVFGHTHDGTHIHFMVGRRQAAWAEYLLLQAGVALQNPTAADRSSSRHAAHDVDQLWRPVAASHIPDAQGEVNGFNQRERSVDINSRVDDFIERLSGLEL